MRMLAISIGSEGKAVESRRRWVGQKLSGELGRRTVPASVGIVCLLLFALKFPLATFRGSRAHFLGAKLPIQNCLPRGIQLYN